MFEVAQLIFDVVPRDLSDAAVKKYVSFIMVCLDACTVPKFHRFSLLLLV